MNHVFEVSLWYITKSNLNYVFCHFNFQVELENLNTATDDINKLEIELDVSIKMNYYFVYLINNYIQQFQEAHTTFNKLLSDSTRQLKEIANKVGPNTIEKARCYYEAVEVARRAQVNWLLFNKW